MVDLLVPKAVPPGDDVNVVMSFGPEWAGKTVGIEAYWIEGTSSASYSKLVNKQGRKLGQTTVTIKEGGENVSLGRYKQPSEGSMVGAFLIVPGFDKPVFYYEKVGTDTWELNHGVANPFQVDVSPKPVVYPGDKLKVEATVYFTGKFHGYIKAFAFNKVYTSATATTSNSPARFSFSIPVPSVYGDENIRVALIDANTGKTVATKTVTITVGRGYVPPTKTRIEDALMRELKRWYKNNLGLANYDWSTDVTEIVSKVRNNVKKAVLAGWYQMNTYTYLGKDRPAPRNAEAIVSGWEKGKEYALFPINESDYPNLEGGQYGWYMVEVPCKLTVEHSGPEPGPGPGPTPGPGTKTNNIGPLLLFGSLALGWLFARGK